MARRLAWLIGLVVAISLIGLDHYSRIGDPLEALAGHLGSKYVSFYQAPDPVTGRTYRYCSTSARLSDLTTEEASKLFDMQVLPSGCACIIDERVDFPGHSDLQIVPSLSCVIRLNPLQVLRVRLANLGRDPFK